MKKLISYGIMSVITVNMFIACNAEKTQKEETTSTEAVKEVAENSSTASKTYDMILDKWWMADNGAYQYFGADGSYKNHPDMDMQGTWKWVEEGKKMTVTMNGQDNELEIKEFSSDKLVVSMMGMSMTFSLKN